ncbi:hypothetical protein I6N96_12770 [Enterococcus sp. BWM-S5]|uniref:Lipoprotein n=1 Tax=Enterococcus larvae TaxID=2794352 RepID=A0ABS4CKL9_9ENTE|nr:hypothetical protein [Enterococcus larvae]MBP1047147.1 hypothetical protein [Enterococcus larvae]
MKLKNLFYISIIAFLLFLTGCSDSSAVDKTEEKNDSYYEKIIDGFVANWDGDLSNVTEAQVYNIEEIEGVKASSILIHVVGDYKNERRDFPNSDWYGIYIVDKTEWYEGTELTATDRVEEMIKASELLYEKEY